MSDGSGFGLGAGAERLRVTKIPVRVSVVLIGGTLMDGEVHVFPGVGDSRERVSDLLNGPEDFLPLTRRAETVLLGKREIALLRVPGRFDAHLADPGSVVIPEVQVEITVGGVPAPHAVHSGRLVIDMPRDQARLLDYLNGEAAFVPLVGDDQIWMIGRRHIRVVRSVRGRRQPGGARGRTPRTARRAPVRTTTTPGRPPRARPGPKRRS